MFPRHTLERDFHLNFICHIQDYLLVLNKFSQVLCVKVNVISLIIDIYALAFSALN